MISKLASRISFIFLLVILFGLDINHVFAVEQRHPVLQASTPGSDCAQDLLLDCKEESVYFSKEEILHDFHNIAFALDDFPNGRPLSKWETPIVYEFRGKEITSYQKSANILLSLISKWSGLAILHSSNTELEFNYGISFLGPELLAAAKKRFPSDDPDYCKLLTGYGPDGYTIRKTVIYVDINLSPRKIAGCLTRTIFGSIGLASSKEADNSLFNPDVPPVIQPKDEAFVRILYDKNLRPGSKWLDVKSVVGKIISQNNFFGQLRFSP